MIRIAFCDDNETIISLLEEYISQIKILDIDYDFFYSGTELLNYLEKNTINYHIYILDISMPKFTGIETAEMIRSKDKNCIIIFLTDYKEYVYQVFKSLPFRFLKKPIDKNTFHTVLMEAIKHLKTIGNLFFFHIERDHYQIPYSEIVFFESQKRKVRLITTTTEYLFYKKIKDIHNEIDFTIFVQCHVSFIVNMEHIHSINDKMLILRNHMEIPISKTYRTSAKLSYLEFVKGRC